MSWKKEGGLLSGATTVKLVVDVSKKEKMEGYETTMHE